MPRLFPTRPALSPAAQSSTHAPSRARQVALTAGVLIWATLLAGATTALTRYEQSPIYPSLTNAPDSLTAAADSPRIHPLPTVRMYAHPRCPCTRASVNEFSRLVAAYPHAAHYEVFFFRPANEPDAWAHSDLWASATRIPGVTVHADPDAVEARRAGAQASGHVVIYNPSGDAVFSGGITLSRGHSGDNPALDSALNILDHFTRNQPVPSSPAPLTRAPVFGCAIHTAPAPP